MVNLQERYIQSDSWSDLVMGNYALVRAMLEAGVQVVSTYPGSPTPEIAAALDSIPLEQRPYYFEYSTNEKVALELACGASLNGHLSCVFFKSVGLNVASDAMVQLSLMELVGGMVVVLGDDPGCNSSQNEQDNRHFMRMSYLPLFEPGDPIQARAMFLEAAELAKRDRTAVVLRLTTHVCHAKQMVDFGPLPQVGADWTPRFDTKAGPYVPVGATVPPLKRRALAKLAAFAAYADESPANCVLAPHGSDGKLGLLASGLPALAALECLEAAGEPVDLFQLGMSYPLPSKRLVEFMRAHEQVLVIEELDRVLETELKALAYDEGLDCRLVVRDEPEEMLGEMGPERIQALLSRKWPDRFSPPVTASPDDGKSAPRLPQMCPGCGHRSAFHAIAKALGKDDITVADIGCHTLGFMPPYEIGQVLLCMGHSTGTGAGLSLGQKKRKVVSFIGDSTLFHAGLPGILNALVHNHDLTLVIMENGTTAMTGHQPRLGSGEIGPRILIKDLMESLGIGFVREVDTYQQAKLTETMVEAMAHEGFAVVIAKHPCMLKFTRDARRRSANYKPVPVQVDGEKCTEHHICTATFACPSFVRHEDGSVTVHEDLCIGDGSCIQVCPENAIGRSKPGGES
ncbi:MAG: 4Fe-4S binding protein [Deltaproteobacteria bacterium]|nr:4Fe-4S binding protein [Deltaproteobacteria bacterium]